jgi:putative ABC transport system permease protein
MPEWTKLVRTRLADARVADPSADIVDELSLHLEETYRAALAAGRTPEAARAAAEAELADIGAVARAARTRRRPATRAGAPRRRWVGGLVGDLRQAIRLLRGRKGASATIVLTLAVGIGACTAVFSIVRAALLQPLPYSDPDRLVLLWEGDDDDPESTYIVAAPVYEDWRARNRTLEHLGIWEFRRFNVAAGTEPEHVRGIRMSASLFDVLRVAPALGRTWTPEEDQSGRRVAVISDAIWRSQFASAPDVLARRIRLNDAMYDVIGVMPPGFEFPQQGSGVYVPIAFDTRDRIRDSHSFFVAGRLRHDVALEQARDDFARIGRALGEEYSENRGEASRVTLMADLGVGTLRTMLTVLFGAVVFVLLIACVNVANLQIGLAVSRRREFATRAALGAGPGRLAGQVLIESLVLAAGGLAGGVVLAWVGTRGLDAVLGPQFLTFWFRGQVPVVLDGGVLIFATGLSLASALLFGLAPLAGVRHGTLQPMLREGTRHSTRPGLSVRRVLVATEVALALVVLCGAGLLIRSIATLLRVDPGLDPTNVVTLEVALPQDDTYGPAVRATFCESLARSGATPVFASVGAVSHLPLSGANAGRGITIEGRPAPAPNQGASAAYRITCPGYFRTLGIRIVAGRDFSLRDLQNGDGVVIINRVTAERYWPNENPIGRRLKIGGYSSRAPWLTVVGMVENVRHFGLEAEPVREIFVPYGQAAWPTMTLVARTAGLPTAAAQRELRDVLRRTDPSLPAAKIQPMTAVVEGSIGRRASFMRLLVIFASMGLLLAAVGVYGVLAYYVSQRTRELGVRVALGATRRMVVLLVLRQAFVPISAGLAIGMLGSVWTSRLLADLLFQVEPGDPAVTAAIVTLLAGVGLAASWIPARRASALDPVVALREET